MEDTKTSKGCAGPPPAAQLENVDDLTARAFHAFGKVAHLNRILMSRAIAQKGIQPPEAFALSLLAQNDGITQRELADILHLSHPRVSIILRSLEVTGSIVRRSDSGDRRLARVFLTPEGRRLEQEQRDVLSSYVRGTIGALSEVDRRALEQGLNKLAERLVVVLRESGDAGPQGEDETTS